jgi:hypothetical protein
MVTLQPMVALANGRCSCDYPPRSKINVYVGGMPEDSLADIQPNYYCDCPQNKGKGGFDLDLACYRQPHVPHSTAADRRMSCRELQQAINAIEPLTYSFKPGFYDDPVNGAAVVAGTFVAWPAYLAMICPLVKGYKEDARIAAAQNRIEDLRRLKAEKHCFERLD